MAIRILTAVTLVNIIVGGPDIMLFWGETGRHAAAETRADAAEQQLDERNREIGELRAIIADLQERVATQEQRASRHTRPRRRLRNNGQ